MSEAIIVVGHTETNEYGDLLVTPQGGGEQVKIKQKRAKLFPLFEQGKAVVLDWQTFQGHPYVADAKMVVDGLPPSVKPTILPEQQAEIDKALAEASPPVKPQPSGQETGMWIKELGEWLRMKEQEKGADPFWKALRKLYFAQMFSVLNLKIEDKKEE